MTAKPPSAETLAAAVRGDDLAWHELHRDWAPVVLRWTVYLGGGRVDADEAARDVFFRLWKLIARIERPEVFRSYLYSVTRRVISEHRRRAWWRRWSGEEVPNHAAPGADPDTLVHSRRTVAQVQQLLEQLRERDREIIVLCDVLGHTTAEAAEILTIQPNTAKSRLSRARARFGELARQRQLGPMEDCHV